jgi:hypothetical protein
MHSAPAGLKQAAAPSAVASHAAQRRPSAAPLPQGRPAPAAQPGLCRTCKRAARLARVAMQAVAAPEDLGLRTYDAAAMSPEDMADFNARPRIDFSAILRTVRHCPASCAGCIRGACL